MPIVDHGKNNTIIAPEGIDIRIVGDNNVIEILPSKFRSILVDIRGNGNNLRIGELKHCHRARFLLRNGANVTLGDGSTIQELSLITDSADIHIGKNCMISNLVTIRTSDGHGIYDMKTGNIINAPKSIKIDDHVWLAQMATVGKGAFIGSGSVIGARSLVQNVTIPNNCVAAGSPARVVKEGIIWDARMAGNIYDIESQHSIADTEIT